MTNKIRPTNVTADRTKRVLTIEWSDGSKGIYPFPGLRAICPCVMCQGGHENMGRPADKQLLREAEDAELNMEAANAVGSYAIAFVWNDGHDSGIYTWGYLYAAGRE